MVNVFQPHEEVPTTIEACHLRDRMQVLPLRRVVMPEGEPKESGEEFEQCNEVILSERET